MVWRRLLVPADASLRELHGILQVAMGWDGIHLFQLRAARYGSSELSAFSPAAKPASFQLRVGSRLVYEYDLNIPWRHEVRVEQRLEPKAGQACPACIGGHGERPAEDCGRFRNRWGRAGRVCGYAGSVAETKPPARRAGSSAPLRRGCTQCGCSD